MFIFYTGLPGSGKSYRVVHDLLQTQNSKKGKKYYVYHNIDGLKEENFNDPFLINDWRDLITEGYCADEIQFFSEEFQTQLCREVQEKYGLPVLIIIDEAHRWFDRDRKSLKAWVSFHRHLGQDIWMVTQKQTMIHNSYRGLAEYEKRAKNNSLFDNPFVFIYSKICNGQTFGTEFKRKKKKVFEAYKSFEANNKKTVSLVIPAILCVIVLCGFLYYSLAMNRGGDKKEKQVAKAQEVEQEQVQADVDPQHVKSLQVEVDQLEPESEPEPEHDRPASLMSLEEIENNLVIVGSFGNEIIVRDMESGVISQLKDFDPYLKVQNRINNDVADIHDRYTGKFIRVYSEMQHRKGRKNYVSKENHNTRQREELAFEKYDNYAQRDRAHNFDVTQEEKDAIESAKRYIEITGGVND